MSDSLIVLVIAGVWLAGLAGVYCLLVVASADHSAPSPLAPAGMDGRRSSVRPSGPTGTTCRRAATQASGRPRDLVSRTRLIRSNERRPGTSHPEAP